MDQALDFLYETKFARLKEIHTQVPRWKSAHEEWKNAQEMYTRELLNVRLAVLDREVEEEYHVENMKKWQSKANSYEEERMQENESFRSDVLQLHQEVEKWRDLKKKKKEHHDRLLAGMSFNLAMVKEDQTKVEAIKRDYEKMEHDMQQFAENMLQQLHTIKDRIRERKMTKEKYERNVAEKLNYINDSMEASKMALERKTNFVLQRKQALVEAQNSMAKKRKAMEKDLSEREETSGPNKVVIEIKNMLESIVCSKV